MPLTATAIPQRLLINRRSCEGAVYGNRASKADLDMNHRSIQSDPGVNFELIHRRSDGLLITDRVMQKLEAARADVVMRRRHTGPGSLYGAPPALTDLYPRRAGTLPPSCKYYPTEQCLYELDMQKYRSPADRRRNQDNRRVYVLDSQILEHKYSYQGRVKSTSLSSSATSLYSEDDFVRSSMNASPVPSFTSDCPSVISAGSRRNSWISFSDEDDEESIVNESEDTSQEEEDPLNNNNNDPDEHGIVEIDGNILLVNLKNFRHEQESAEETEQAEVRESVFRSVLASVPEESPKEEEISCSCQSREVLTDNEADEYERCAISEFWHLEEDGHRWSRTDSKASSVGCPAARLASTRIGNNSLDGILEDSSGDVFTVEGFMKSMNGEDEVKMLQENQQKQWINPSNDERMVGTKSVFKPKTNSFLKRVGSDFKKLGSFRRKELLHRANSTEGAIEGEQTRHKNRNDSRNKSWRKNRKVTIGEPMLQSGHERLDQMRCVPIDATGPAGLKDLQNQHRGRKNSSHSLVSSSSSSGGASTASTPAPRTRHSNEDFTSDIAELSGIHARNRMLLDANMMRNRTEPQQDKENVMFVIPRGYKPGTFPSAIHERADQDDVAAAFSSPSSASSTRSHSTSDSHPIPSQEPSKRMVRPMSIYDNLPDTALQGNASAQDIINILDPSSPLGGVDDSGVYEGSVESLEPVASAFDAAFWSVDAIVEYTQSLQQMMGSLDEEESPEESKSDVQEQSSADQSDRHLPSTVQVLPSYSSENISTAEDEVEQSNNSEQRAQCRLRWKSFNRDHAPSTSSRSLQLHTLSVGQLMILRRLSMLKLTALMESYAFSNSKGTLNWSVPRFIRRIKVQDYKDKTVFGVPLLHNVQRFGQPLPQCIQHALAYLRRTSLDQVGLFRKPGVRSRIQRLRAKCENNPDLRNFDDCSAYDVADMVKQFFRELPDPLMTMKMSETFVGIFLYVPEELRLQTLQAATMILPDETRETLKTLLCFLADVASKSDENHMNESNLSTCFSPSLFYQQFNNPRMMTSSSSPKIRKSLHGKTSNMALGKPDMKEMNENMAANQCLAFMIRHVKDLFKISEDAMTQCRMSVMQQTDDVLASEIGYTSDATDEGDYYTDFHAYVDRVVAQTMREEQRISQNKGGWQSVASTPGSELLCKKMNDGNPLRLWRSQVEVTGADQHQIMERILNERHVWDEDLLQWKVLQQPDDRTQLFQTVRSEMSPHPTRDYCVLRSWRNDVSPRGGVAIVETSTGQQSLLGDVRGVILTSRYVIEPTGVPNKCTLTHVSRVDVKGRNPEWYNKAYGHIVTQQLLKIRDSIRSLPPKSIAT